MGYNNSLVTRENSSRKRKKCSTSSSTRSSSSHSSEWRLQPPPCPQLVTTVLSHGTTVSVAVSSVSLCLCLISSCGLRSYSQTDQCPTSCYGHYLFFIFPVAGALIYF